jgi:hypothetical protein
MGLHNHCRDCQRAYRREWYLRNAVAERAKSAEYSRTDKGKAVNRKSHEAHKEQRLAANRERRRTDAARSKANAAARAWRGRNISNRLAVNLRTRLRRVTLGHRRRSAVLGLLGCDLESFKRHLESLFQPDMTWENYGYRGWHIDHVIPCTSFDLASPAEQARCFHYTNLQPLWRWDNQSKGNKT